MSDEEIESPRFKKETLQLILETQFKDANTKVGPGAQSMTTEYLRQFTIEAFRRARDQANNENSSIVEVSHLEKILPGLLIDFL